jgi:hypothetical protein
MGFLKNLGRWFGKTQPKTGGPSKPPRRGTVPAAPSPDDPGEQEAANLLRGLDREEARLLGGERIDVESSNVGWFQYFQKDEELHVGFLDGSVYAYYRVPLDTVFQIWRAGSKGGAIWDLLRVRGTVFGYKFEYAFLDGASTSTRKWHEGVPGQRNKKGQFLSKSQAGLESRKRHGALGPAGEPYKGYHPATAFGKGGLGKKRGKRK